MDKMEKRYKGHLLLESLKPPLPSNVIVEMERLKYVTMPWRTGFQQRLRGELTDRCRDQIFLARLEGRVVGQMWYTVDGACATFGQVFVDESIRKQGIASSLIEFCLEFMDEEPGLEATYLGVSNIAAMQIYLRYGWKEILFDGNCRIMRRLARGVNETEYDRRTTDVTGELQMISATRSALPRMEAFFNQGGETLAYSRNFLHGILAGHAVECQIDAMINEVECGWAVCNLMVNRYGFVVGAAFGRNAGAYWGWDFFTLNVSPETECKLLTSIMTESKAARHYSEQAGCDARKIACLQHLGLVECGRLVDWYSDKGKTYDKIIFAK